jgi:ribosomal protein L37E
MSNQYSTREEWLTAGVEELRPLFDLSGKTLPKQIRVSCGFPSTAMRSGAIGECWISTASADGTFEILIHPKLADPVEVFEVLVHELCHATAGAFNHGINFQKVAMTMHLLATGTGRQPWKSTKGDSVFMDVYADIIAGLGAYPHAALKSDRQIKKQTTRLLKAVCPSCGYTVRLTQKWADQGLPTCPCGDTLAL